MSFFIKNLLDREKVVAKSKFNFLIFKFTFKLLDFFSRYLRYTSN